MESQPQHEIDEVCFQKIYNYLVSNISVVEVLEKVNPGLKTLYDNRTLHYNPKSFSGIGKNNFIKL